ncbi:polyketide synthase dehydratase domain-containing protein [Streptomyces sp. NPDC086838]|uniref:polyketide synthase dehydratase domain-containing protein n=1 Tax=Streptomyces sp. NPDC086838 TaxID=3365762 RepID=UPI003809D835
MAARRGATPLNTGDLYDELASPGYGFGPAFRNLTAARRAGGTVHGVVPFAPELHAGAVGFVLRPALLDTVSSVTVSMVMRPPGARSTAGSPVWDRHCGEGRLRGSKAARARPRPRRSTGPRAAGRCRRAGRRRAGPG